MTAPEQTLQRPPRKHLDEIAKDPETIRIMRRVLRIEPDAPKLDVAAFGSSI